MNKCYISGAISGTKDYEKRFKKAEFKVRELGYEPINPADYLSILPPTTSWLEYMKYDVALMASEGCNAIYMLDGWRASRGAKIELELALGAGFTVFSESSL